MKQLKRLLLLLFAILILCGNAPPPPNLYEEKIVCEGKADGTPCTVGKYRLKSMSCSYDYERYEISRGTCRTEKILCPTGEGTCDGLSRCITSP